MDGYLLPVYLFLQVHRPESAQTEGVRGGKRGWLNT